MNPRAITWIVMIVIVGIVFYNIWRNRKNDK